MKIEHKYLADMCHEFYKLKQELKAHLYKIEELHDWFQLSYQWVDEEINTMEDILSGIDTIEED